MKVILFAGKARVGKTTATTEFMKTAYNLGMTPKRLSFADPIKEAAAAQGLTKEETPNEYRAFAIEYGRDRRAEDPDFFIKMWLERALEFEEEENTRWREGVMSETVLICDDLRFPNEIEALRVLDPTVIYVHQGSRPLEDEDAEFRKGEAEAMAEAVYQAEDADLLEEFDHFFINNQTPEHYALLCSVASFYMLEDDDLPIIIDVDWVMQTVAWIEEQLGEVAEDCTD